MDRSSVQTCRLQKTRKDNGANVLQQSFVLVCVCFALCLFEFRDCCRHARHGYGLRPWAASTFPSLRQVTQSLYFIPNSSTVTENRGFISPSGKPVRKYRPFLPKIIQRKNKRSKLAIQQRLNCGECMNQMEVMKPLDV